jgi:hypothetical protein
MNRKSSFQDDRNAMETGAIFPIVPSKVLWPNLGYEKEELRPKGNFYTGIGS